MPTKLSEFLSSSGNEFPNCRVAGSTVLHCNDVLSPSTPARQEQEFLPALLFGTSAKPVSGWAEYFSVVPLADRTNGRAYATVLRPTVVCL